MSKKIVKKLLQYRPCPKLDARLKKPGFSSWGLDKQTVKLLCQDPNAFLFAGLFDYLIDARDAWEVPRKLKKRLGYLDIRKLERTPKSKLAKSIARNGDSPALHRFPNRMADRVKSAAKKLQHEYQGSAKNIWKRDKPDAKEVIKRLRAFNGIGQKISNMLVRLLVTYYGVHLKGWEKIDIAVDRHVARVFLRSGIIDPPSRKKMYRVSEVRRSIIEQARSLSPKYPGALDESAFLVGKIWCQAEYAYCEVDDDDEDGPCPLKDVCPRNIDYGIL